MNEWNGTRNFADCNKAKMCSLTATSSTQQTARDTTIFPSGSFVRKHNSKRRPTPNAVVETFSNGKWTIAPNAIRWNTIGYCVLRRPPATVCDATHFLLWEMIKYRWTLWHESDKVFQWIWNHSMGNLQMFWRWWWWWCGILNGNSRRA